MELRETAAILAMVTALDSRRSFGELDAKAWQAVIGDFSFDDCREALIGHYRESPHSITPSDIATRVAAARRARIGNRVAPLPPVDPNDVVRYKSWIGAWSTAIADGADDEEAAVIANAEVGAVPQAVDMRQRAIDVSSMGRRPE